MNSKRTIIAIVVFILFLGFAYFLYHTLADDFNGTNLGSQNGQNQSGSDEPVKAPDFTVMDADGNPVSLSDFAGKPIVINFWATWCGYCKEEMPFYEKSYQENKDDIVFLMINATDGQRETKEKAEAYMQEHGYTFPVYYDYNGDAIYNYNATGLPTSVFIDKDGNILVYQPGILTAEKLHQYLDMIR